MAPLFLFFFFFLQLFPVPCFLECCVDKLTQTPVIFTPGMQRAREKGQGDMGERRDGREKVQGREAGKR